MTDERSSAPIIPAGPASGEPVPPKRKPRGVPWQKGKSGNPKGRPKGAVALEKREREQTVQRVAEAIIFDQGQPLRKLKGKKDKYTLEEVLAAKPYLEGLLYRIKTGQADHMERFFAEHFFGKPVVKVKVEEPVRSPLALAMAEMTAEEVQALAAAARKALAIQRARSLGPATTESGT